MKKSRITDIALIVLYKIVLDVMLIQFVLPLYGYMLQYSLYGSINTAKIAFSYLIVCICMVAFWVIPKKAHVSQFVLMSQLVFILVPYLALYGAIDIPTWHLGIILFGYVVVLSVARASPAVRFKPPSAVSRYFFVGVMLAIMAYVYGGLIATGGLSRLNFDFSAIYVVRDMYADETLSTLPGMGYFVPWTAYIFNMTILVICLRSFDQNGRKLAIVGVAAMVILQVLLFGMTNFKAFLILPFAVSGLYILSKRLNVVGLLLTGSLGFVILMAIWSYAGGMFGAALINRMFFVPAALHSLYFDYFSVHPKALFSGRAFADLFGSIYDETPVAIVAQSYWGRSFSPNVGWVGDAYANFGLFGVLIYGAFLALVLRVADGFLGGVIAPGIVAGLMLGMALALGSSALPTAFSTSGGFAALIVLWVLKGAWRKDELRAIP